MSLDRLGERVESERDSHLGVWADNSFAKVKVIDLLELPNWEQPALVACIAQHFIYQAAAIT